MQKHLWALVLAYLIIAPAYAGAEPNKAQYELQERCGKRVTEFVEKEYGRERIYNKYIRLISPSFVNHYNPTLNRCFVLLTLQVAENSNMVVTEISLIDVNENRDIGSIVLVFDKINSVTTTSFCDMTIKQQPCHSEFEWREFVKSYMKR
jgi:hypothetical protein